MRLFIWGEKVSSSNRLTITLDVENSKLLAGFAQSDTVANKFARSFIVNMDQAQQKHVNLLIDRQNI